MIGEILLSSYFLIKFHPGWMFVACLEYSKTIFYAVSLKMQRKKKPSAEPHSKVQLQHHMFSTLEQSHIKGGRE